MLRIIRERMQTFAYVHQIGHMRILGTIVPIRDRQYNFVSTNHHTMTGMLVFYVFFAGENQGTAAKVKLLLKALFLCWDRRNQDLHVDWILFRGRSLTPIYAEVVDDNASGHYPSDHYPLYVEFSLPRSVRHLDETTG